MYIYVRLPDGIPQARLLCITMERKYRVTSLPSSGDDVRVYIENELCPTPGFHQDFLSYLCNSQSPSALRPISAKASGG
jgi:hypothetical protein